MSLKNTFGLAQSPPFAQLGQAAIVDWAISIANEITNDAQTLTTSGTVSGGTFTLTFMGQTTAAIQFNAGPGAVQAALAALSNVGVGNVVCTGGPLPGTGVVCTFVGSLAGQALPAMTFTSSLTGGGTLVVTHTTTGVSVVNHAKNAALASKVLAGTVRCDVGSFIALGIADNATILADFPFNQNGSGNYALLTSAITGATNASPIQITSTAHGRSTNDVVSISGVLGNTAANGDWTITVVDANNFTLNGSAGNGAYTSGGVFVATSKIDGDIKFQVSSIMPAYA